MQKKKQNSLHKSCVFSTLQKLTLHNEYEWAQITFHLSFQWLWSHSAMLISSQYEGFSLT